MTHPKTLRPFQHFFKTYLRSRKKWNRISLLLFQSAWWQPLSLTQPPLFCAISFSVFSWIHKTTLRLFSLTQNNLLRRFHNEFFILFWRNCILQVTHCVCLILFLEEPRLLSHKMADILPAIGSWEGCISIVCKGKNQPPAWIHRMCVGWELWGNVSLTRAKLPTQPSFIHWASANHHCYWRW